MNCLFFFCKHHAYYRHLFDWNSLWSALTALGTLALVVVAYKQIQSLIKTNEDANRTATEDFLYKLKKDFFTREARTLLTLLEIDSLKFEEISEDKDFRIFKVIIPDNIKKYIKDSIDTKKTYYTTQEIDDFLLQHLEDLGLLFYKGMITIEDADQQFEYYLKTIFEDNEIKAYINWAREQANDNDIYSKFELLYHSVELYEKRQRK